MSPRPKSLRSQIVVTVTAVVVGYAALDHTIQRKAVSPNFEELERTEAVEDLERVIGALDREAEHLDMRCRDQATWDDTYRFVQEPFDDYVRSNLGTAAFEAGNINLLYICASDGRVVWGDAIDLETGAALELPELPREALVPNHQFMVHYDVARGTDALNGYIHGLVMMNAGPMLVSCRPILASDGSGPIRGTVIMGRLISQSFVDELGARTAVRFHRWATHDPAAMPESDRAQLDEVTGGAGAVLRERDEEILHVYGAYRDIRENPALMLRADVERSISARGAKAVRYALVSTVGSGILLLLVLLGVLQRTVLKPIEKLTEHAVGIGRTDDSSARLDLRREDEIGILGREFDSMLEKLAQSRAAVVKTARKAGMSEIATGILHNVGNVLNSVNVSATMVTDRVKNSKITKLERLSQMVEKQGDQLGDFITNNPKGKHVGPYIAEVTGLMKGEQENVLDELGELEKGIEHIRQLVNSQQSYAGQNELRELTDLVDGFEQAIRLSEQASPDGGKIAIVREFEDLPRVAVDQHKLTEILVNLMTNARQAMESARVRAPRLTLRVTAADERVRLEVADNGVGISAEDQAAVFNHGFTTKAEGHGFGLHSAANAAVEMKGKLSVHSDGAGHGATFTLELPLDTNVIAS
jgi:sensor domain CHASE-containing protein/anti-sigma regulatory factor (Ser/Thr protein kinase)